MAKARIFVSYAHDDKEWVLEGLDNIHLIPRIKKHVSTDADIWFDEGLVVGEKWNEEIYSQINKAQISILLISENFISSDYIVNKEIVWIKECVEEKDMKIIPLLIGNITEKSKKVIDWIYQRQIHPSETQPLCNYLKDKAQWDQMITTILNIIDDKIDIVLANLLQNDDDYINKPVAANFTSPTEGKTAEPIIEMGKEVRNSGGNDIGSSSPIYQEAIKLYRNRKYKETSEILLKLSLAGNAEAQNLLCDLMCNKIKFYQMWPEVMDTYLPYAEENYVFAQTIVGKLYCRGAQNLKKDYEKAYEWLKKASDHGNSYAEYLLGSLYENGNFVELNYETALTYYRASAAQNNVMAISEIAFMQQNGYGMPMNKDEAEKTYLQLAEERDDEWSMLKLACIENERKNPEKQLEWIQKAIDKGYVEAYFSLGVFYQYATDEYKNLELAQENYYHAAQLGNPDGMNGLGLIYYEMPDNVGNKQAFRWFSKSANLDDSLGLYYLALMYEEGYGTEVDKKKAWECYLSSANQRFSFAYRKIAQMIEAGESPTTFIGKELEYYTKAAERNDIDGIHDVIRLIEDDTSRQEELYQWCKRGTELGDGLCICKLGKLYFYGKGVELDEFKAKDYFRQAEVLNIPEAYYYLGKAYYEAKGVVSPNIQKAEEYFIKAVDAGYSNAISTLAELYMQNSSYDKAKEYLLKAIDSENSAIAYEGLMSITVEQMTYEDYADTSDSTLYREALQYEAAGKEAGMKTPLGCIFYRKGKELCDIEKYESAISPLLQAAHMGESDAATRLGDLYFFGNGIDIDYAEAYKWFLEASGKGDAYAQYSLAFMYKDGLYVEKNDAQIVKWMKMAAENGYLEAQKNMGEYYYYGNYGCSRDIQEAIRWYEKGAESNEQTCLFSLGIIYENGYGVQKNVLKAADWYRKGTKAGHSSCMYNLGLLITTGEINGNKEEGIELIRRSADKGYVYAQNRMGKIYRYGLDMKVSAVRATNWFTKAAEQDFSDAMCNLGDMYSHKDGLCIDYSKARFWYEKAAVCKHSRAFTELGDLYYSGKGVEKDYVKAFEYFLQACDDDYAYALYSVGHMYWKGQGTEKNRELAGQYLSRASAMGYENAFKALSDMMEEQEEDITKEDPYAIQAYEEALLADQNHDTEGFINLLTQSANLGYHEAMTTLGDLYFNGKQVDKDMKKAYEYFLKASEIGSGYGSYSCGFMLSGGQGVPRDADAGKKMFELAISRGYKQAHRGLARYYNSLKTQDSYSKSLEHYLQYLESNTGDVECLKKVGLFYEHGRGTTVNLDLARKYYEQAAALDDDEAYDFLGGTYMAENATEEEDRKAVYYLKKAVDRKNANAMFRLSIYVRRGEGGMEKNLEYELDLLHESSRLGNASASYRLGILYENGDCGLTENKELTIRYFQLAAERGYLPSINKLGEYYLFGEVIPRDNRKAVSFFKVASKDGYGCSSYWLGRLHAEGIGGLEKSTDKAIEFYELAISQGYTKSQKDLDKLRENLIDNTVIDIAIPDGITDDDLFKEAKEALSDSEFRKAYIYFTHLANKGHAESFNELGDMYFYGHGVGCNKATAMEYYMQSAGLNNVNGYFNVGYLYWLGASEIHDEQQALSYFKKAAELGNTYALKFIGDIYSMGGKDVIDYAEAKRYYQKGIDAKELTAISGMGTLYLRGLGVVKNNAMAAFYFKKAADKGNVYSMYRLGLLYHRGDGIPRDLRQALDYLQKAYDSNYASACSALGLLYEMGEGTARNVELANTFYQRGCELGDETSMRFLGNNYKNGNGVPKDYHKAIDLFLNAIKNGETGAGIDLADMLFKGMGVEQDVQRAMEFLQPCLDEGYGRAFYLMGQMLEKGIGVEKDYAKAKECFQVALDKGLTYASEDIDRLDKFV